MSLKYPFFFFFLLKKKEKEAKRKKTFKHTCLDVDGFVNKAIKTKQNV